MYISPLILTSALLEFALAITSEILVSSGTTTSYFVADIAVAVIPSTVIFSKLTSVDIFLTVNVYPICVPFDVSTIIGISFSSFGISILDVSVPFSCHELPPSILILSVVSFVVIFNVAVLALVSTST